MKIYEVSDLFFTRWKDLSPKVHAIAFALQQQALEHDKATPQYGLTLIEVLKTIRKNKMLAGKINVEQAVDIYNSLSFLNEPWYHFPALVNKVLPLITPTEKLTRISFDQFIYADNEFTSYVIDHDEKFLRRLIVTLYLLPDEEFFDKEKVEARADALKGKLKEWQLMQVFFTFAQMRGFIMDRCKALLPKPAKKANEETEDPARSTGPMWYKIKHYAASTLVFGTFDELGESNMYSVLDHLEHIAQEKKSNGKS